MSKYLIFFYGIFALVSCQKEPVTFLALGDSYTIGESVTFDQRWPVQLSTKLEDKNKTPLSIKFVAKTGWTTDELLAAIDTAQLEKNYDYVSLLIGVNNQYRGYPMIQFQSEFEELVKYAVEKAGSPKRVLIVTIPDYGVTPFGQTKDPESIATEIDQYNLFMIEKALEYEIAYVDINPESKKALNDPSLVAEDGLHPSGKMYGEWADLILDKHPSFFK